MIGAIREIFRYRELVRCLVEKELKLRYKRSVLGVAWTMLNPLLMMVILTVVFSHVMRVQIERFPVFLLSALLPWNFLAQSISGASLSIVHNESLIKKVYVPRAVFPLAMVLSHLVNLLFAFIPLLLVMIVLRAPIGPSIVAVLPALLALSLFALGVSLALSALTVVFRDITHLIDVGLMAWFYFTPVLYSPEMIPERYARLFAANPMFHLLAPFRAALYEGRFPPAESYAVAAAIALAAVVIGFAIFRSREREFVIHLS